MYKLNDKVVYPGHGVAVVKEISEKKIGSTNVTFFKLVFLYKDMTILVPIYNVKSIGIRNPSPPKTVEQTYKELLQQPEKRLESIDFTPSGWNKRNKEYQQKIQSGLLLEIAKIYRDLMYVSQQKDLSFGERTLLQTTEDLLVQELQAIKEIDKEKIVQEVRAPFKKLVFQDKNYPRESAVSSAVST